MRMGVTFVHHISMILTGCFCYILKKHWKTLRTCLDAWTSLLFARKGTLSSPHFNLKHVMFLRNILQDINLKRAALDCKIMKNVRKNQRSSALGISEKGEKEWKLDWEGGNVLYLFLRNYCFSYFVRVCHQAYYSDNTLLGATKKFLLGWSFSSIIRQKRNWVFCVSPASVLSISLYCYY